MQISRAMARRINSAAIKRKLRSAALDSRFLIIIVSIGYNAPHAAHGWGCGR
jgi:hypothetical protein